MAKSRKSAHKVNIHHPKMVKTVFILTSLAILAFLTLIVKTTSFKSEPKAGPQKVVIKKDLSTRVVNSLIRRACIRKFNEGSYYQLSEINLFGEVNTAISYQVTGNCKSGVTFYKGMVSVGQFYTGIKKYWYGLFYDRSVSCCSGESDFQKKSDKYCSNVQLYNNKAQPIGTKVMVCNTQCGGEYSVPVYNYFPVPSSKFIRTTKVSCDYPQINEGIYNVVSGICCAKTTY